MVRTKTAGGNIERGTAIQRHFVREAEQIDGVDIVASLSTGKVSIATRTIEGQGAVLDLCADYGADPTFGLGRSWAWMYSAGDNRVSIDILFEEGVEE